MVSSDKKKQAQTEIQEMLFKHQEKALFTVEVQHLIKVARRCCGVPILGECQKWAPS